MLLRDYYLTPYEEWIEQLYISHEITTPEQLTIDEIASKINVWIYFAPLMSKGLEVKPGMYSMNIDSRLTPQQQWLDFLHELCHLLRHAGNQTIMPELFTQAQEDEAERFSLLASMPFFMIKQLNLPYQKRQLVEYLSEVFYVPIELATKRVEQIERRTYLGRYQRTIKEQNQKIKDLMKQDQRPLSSETKRLLAQLQLQTMKGRSS